MLEFRIRNAELNGEQKKINYLCDCGIDKFYHSGLLFVIIL